MRQSRVINKSGRWNEIGEDRNDDTRKFHAPRIMEQIENIHARIMSKRLNVGVIYSFRLFPIWMLQI